MGRKKVKEQDVDSLFYERGQRARVIRLALRLSRPAFEEKYGIARGTLQNWEDARFGGLGERGAKRLVNAFAKDNIHCTVEWFLYGIGADPLVKWREQQKQALPDNVPKKMSKAMQPELAFFHEQHKQVIDTIMPDNAMAPRIFENDVVAGVRYFASDIEKMIGKDCIIQTQKGDTLVRRLDSGNERRGYTLTCPYTGDKVHFPDMNNVAVFSAAPILWVRSPEK
jgi:transcriptional regulator with XRE-family HTH domain